jgi:ATP-dependent helicase/nuclease subunit A
LFVWAPNKDFAAPAVAALKLKAAERRAAEYNRLLYVALTRARDRLLVCGWQPRGEVPATSWYAQVHAGLLRAGAVAQNHAWGGGLRLACAQGAPPDSARASADQAAAALPDWLGAAPDWRPAALRAEPAVPRPLSPSRPEDADLGPVPPARSPLVLAEVPSAGRAGARGRGEVAHSLLQHVPSLPAAARAAAAADFAQAALGDGGAALAAQVMAVVDNPALAPLFGPGSRAEQSLTGLVGDQVITGRVDRMVVLEREVLIADFKTARRPPAGLDKVPVLYVRQMAAYRAVLGLIYPGHEVRCFLIYTEGPVVLEVGKEAVLF